MFNFLWCLKFTFLLLAKKEVHFFKFAFRSTVNYIFQRRLAQSIKIYLP